MFASDRYFKVWVYTVSHCRLLIRSTGDGGIGTRIDLYFGGVGQMLLKPYYDGIRVTEAGPDELALYKSRYGILPSTKLFILEPELNSFVAAGVMQWREDTGSYRDPSYFGHFPGT